GNPNVSPALLPSKKNSPRRPARSALWFGMASRFNERSRQIDGPPYKLFWQTVAIVASMLIFAAIRPSTTGVSTGDTTSTALASTSNDLRQRESGMRSQKTEVAKAAEAQLRQSDYFVAKDFTNHFKTGAHNIATAQKSDLKPNGQGNENQPGSASRTRVIID
ncbi:MAG: hypothetical protein M3Y84_06575, partial [Acidobacteriota bacterium]|nr:hypothetical protein [Acidobacteriota bacterium]